MSEIKSVAEELRPVNVITMSFTFCIVEGGSELKRTASVSIPATTTLAWEIEDVLQMLKDFVSTDTVVKDE